MTGTPPPATAAAAASTLPARKPTSPKASSPKSASPRSPSSQGDHPIQGDMIPADDAGADDDDNDADSAVADDESQRESTASIASSILEYRNIHGRTYHSDRHDAEYFTPNDEQQRQSIDITHHWLVLLLGGKLVLPPVDGGAAQKVLDVGTGTGIWAIDFADEHPEAEVIGTDLSPIQPEWVPPNLKFEIDDCTKEWTFASDSFDLVHMRLLFGAIADWSALFRQAYRVCKPGGWVQTGEAETLLHSDDGTVNDKTTMGTLWNKFYVDASQKMGHSFTVLTDNLQRRGLEEAGFVDIQEVTYKVPMNTWPKDPKLAEIGSFVELTMNNDIEGYTSYLWHQVLGWPAEEYQVFVMMMRKEIKSRKIHSYFTFRYVYGRKPETAPA